MADDPAPITTRTVEHGEASNIPRAQWTWRRWLCFLIVVTDQVLLGVIIDRLTTPGVMAHLAAAGMIGTVRVVGIGLMMLNGATLFIFVAGATATDCLQMVSLLRSTRKETITTATP